MAAGYTRQSSGNIQAGLPIQSADHNNEYNQLQSAFDNTTGHDHSGSASGTGAKIALTTSVTGTLPIANGGTGSSSTAYCNLTTNVTGILPVANGGVGASLAATGGTSQVLQQTSVGGAITVGQLAASNLSNGVTGSGSVVLAASPFLTGSVGMTQTSASTTALAIFMPTGTVNSMSAITATGWSPSFQLLNKDTTQNWYFGIDDNASKALKIGRGYGPNQGVTAAITVTTGDVVSLANALAISSGGTGATTQATAFAATSVVASSITANGYRKEPDGLVRQWGKATITNGNSSVVVTFPLAFPTALFSFVICGALGALNTIDYGFTSAGTTTITITSSTAAGVGGLDVYWQAVGN